MIILRSLESYQYYEPRPVRVVRVSRGAGRLMRQYAWAEVEGVRPGTRDTVAMTLRGSWRWKLPRPGHPLEVLVWPLSDPESYFGEGSDGFEQPATGAVVCYLYNDTLEHQQAAWEQSRENARQNGWPT